MYIFLNNINLIFLVLLIYNSCVKSIKLSYESYQIFQNNEIILLVDNNGIYAYDSIKSKLINHFYFSNNKNKNKNDNDKLPFISNFYHNGTKYILCLKNKIIYVLNEFGSFLFSINFEDKNYNIFSIYLYQIFNDTDFYFVICYNNSLYTYIKTIMFNINTKEIFEIKTIKIFTLYDINCQIMNSGLYGKVLACFYFKREIRYSLSVFILDLKKELNQITSNSFNYEISAIKSSIKSLISKDYKNAIIYFYNEKYFYLINYFIDTNEFKIYTKRKFTENIIINIKTKIDLIYIYERNYFNNKYSITLYQNNTGLFDVFQLLKKNYKAINSDDKIIKSFNHNYFNNNKRKYKNKLKTNKYSYSYLKNIKKTSQRKLDEILIKCKTTDENSSKNLLCIECNTDGGFYPINYNIDDDDRKYLDKYINKYIDCYNEETVPSNYYLNSEKKVYEQCYSTCLSCFGEGNSKNNNCASCQSNHIFKPEIPNSKNCVKKCDYYYYYNSFGEYMCTDNYYCPEKASFVIEDKNKCINDCNNDDIYKFQYNGECLQKCPDYTQPNIYNQCLEKETKKCTLNSKKIKILGNLLNSIIINTLAKIYAKEFIYTNNHISQLIADNYYILFYKNKLCLSGYNLENSIVDFDDCLKKINEIYHISSPIIAIIDRMGKYKNPTTKYAFFNPETGEKLDTTICENTNITINKNISSFYNNEYDWLVQQNIDIFNVNSSFFSNYCFNFKSNNSKDIALTDRFLLFYQNSSLCEDGCTYNGTNYTSLMTKCICKYNETNYNLFNLNPLEDEQSKLIQEIIFQAANTILVKLYDPLYFAFIIGQCIKYIFVFKYFIRAFGGLIIIGLLLIQVICII